MSAPIEFDPSAPDPMDIELAGIVYVEAAMSEHAIESDVPYLCDRCRDGEHWRCSEPGLCECTEPVDTPPVQPGD